MKKLYVGYLTAGQHGINYSLQAANALIAGGINLLEIGLPFSDPIGDGPVIQQAMQNALANNTTIQDVFNLAKKLRQQHPTLPLVLFSYYNPILHGLKKGILKQAKEAGFDATLIVDLPLEESHDYVQACQQAQLAPIFIVSPDTNLFRLYAINQIAQKFIYYACRKGTTGVKNTLPLNFANKIMALKKYTQLPIVAGFGIASHAMAAEVIKYADGFVVGSHFVAAMANQPTAQELTELALAINPFNDSSSQDTGL